LREAQISIIRKSFRIKSEYINQPKVSSDIIRFGQSRHHRSIPIGDGEKLSWILYQVGEGGGIIDS
jgi:hypothetical protein